MPGTTHQDAERHMRTIVAEAGLPEPDSVEYEGTSIFLYWHEQKLVVEVSHIPVTPPETGPGSSTSGGAAASRDG